LIRLYPGSGGTDPEEMANDLKEAKVLLEELS